VAWLTAGAKADIPISYEGHRVFARLLYRF